MKSRAEQLADLPDDERIQVIRDLWSADEVEALEYDWNFWGRPEQIYRPGPEVYTMVCSGRGWGKSAMGANAAHYVANRPELCGGRPAEGPDDWRAGRGSVIGIAGRVANEVNQTMVDEGIMQWCDPYLAPKWNKSEKTLTWRTGVKARLMSADVPNSFRGPSFSWFWADELAHWSRLPQAWKMLMYTHRKASPGQHPRGLITTTPIGNPTIVSIAWALREGVPIPAGPDTPADQQLQGYIINPRTRVITGSSYDNAANLAEDFLTGTIGQLEGTEDADQEIRGHILMGSPGSPWKHQWFRRCEREDVPHLDQVIVAVDPTVSDGERRIGIEKSCECGIIVMGLARRERRVYMLADSSLVAHPAGWADAVVDAALAHGATSIHAEDNNGGALVKNEVIRALERRRGGLVGRIRVELVKASRSKFDRAALAAPMWQAGAVVHVGSPRLWVGFEGQLTRLDPNMPIQRQRTDRLDAGVWGVLVLLGDGTDKTRPWSASDTEAWRRIAAAVGRGG